MTWMLPDTIEAILFDKDGTLIDFEKTWAGINRVAAAVGAAGDPVLERHLLAACGVDPATGLTVADSLFAASTAREIAARMVAEGSPLDHDALTAALDRCFVDGAEGAVPLTDLPHLFSRLKAAGKSLGIASSDGEQSVRRTVEILGLEFHTDFVSGYDSGHGAKPGPGMVLAFCETAGCRPSNVAVVGDSRHDLEMGRSAGAGAVLGVLSGAGTRESLSPLADMLIDSVADLPDLIGGRF